MSEAAHAIEHHELPDQHRDSQQESPYVAFRSDCMFFEP